MCREFARNVAKLASGAGAHRWVEVDGTAEAVHLRFLLHDVLRVGKVSRAEAGVAGGGSFGFTIRKGTNREAVVGVWMVHWACAGIGRPNGAAAAGATRSARTRMEGSATGRNGCPYELVWLFKALWGAGAVLAISASTTEEVVMSHGIGY